MSFFSGKTDYEFYAAGRWQSSPETIEVLNPADESVLATVPDATAAQCAEALEAAKTAQKAWGRLTGVERGACLRKLADLVDAKKEEFAKLLSKEVGKPIREARGEIDVRQQLAAVLRRVRPAHRGRNPLRRSARTNNSGSSRSRPAWRSG